MLAAANVLEIILQRVKLNTTPVMRAEKRHIYTILYKSDETACQFSFILT